MNVFDWMFSFTMPDKIEDKREDYKCGKLFDKVKYEIMDSLEDKGIRINERELYLILDAMWEWRIVD